MNEPPVPLPGAAPPRERRWRSFAKAVSWRVTGSLDTTLLAFLFTGNLKVSATIGLSEVVTKIILFYAHERIWTRLPFGLSKPAAPGRLASH